MGMVQPGRVDLPSAGVRTSYIGVHIRDACICSAVSTFYSELPGGVDAGSLKAVLLPAFL